MTRARAKAKTKAKAVSPVKTLRLVANGAVNPATVAVGNRAKVANGTGEVGADPVTAVAIPMLIVPTTTIAAMTAIEIGPESICDIKFGI